MNDNRKKLTGILKILYENTDAEHSLDTYQIMDMLSDMGYGRPDRKTIDANIKFIINDLGLGVDKERGRPNRYRWSRRRFSCAELRALTDSLRINPYITKEENEALVDRIRSFASVYEASTIKSAFTPVRSSECDSDLAETVRIITYAVTHSLKVRFMLADYDMDKKVITRDNGLQHTVSPFSLLCNSCQCCLIGVEAGHAEVYDIARIKRISLTDEASDPAPEGFNIDEYKARVFDITEAAVAEVELSCTDKAMNAMIDRFGTDFDLIRTSHSSFNATVSTDLSPSFFGWIFSMGNDVKIISPSWVAAKYREMLSARMDQ